MGKGLKVLLIALIALFLCSPVNALEVVPNCVVSVTDLIGVKDGFGIGILEDQSFNYKDLPGLAREETTNGWIPRNALPLSWEHEYLLSGFSSITDASLEIFTGGQGSYGPSRLFLDEVEIGDLTDGEIGGQNFARLDTFDLSSYLNLLEDGHVTIRVETQYANHSYSDPDEKYGADNWILDYSQLTIYGISDTLPAPVPEPSSILLLGIGLIGLAGYGRKKIINRT